MSWVTENPGQIKKRELKKNNTNLELIYKEKPKKIKINYIEIQSHFESVLCDIREVFGAEIIEKELVSYLDHEMDFDYDLRYMFFDELRKRGAYKENKKWKLP